MPPRRSGLGRGLDALIAPTTAATPPAAGENGGAGARGDAPTGAVEVELGRIQPNPKQPRRAMDEGLLAELAASIREHGLIQPLVVTRVDGEQPGAVTRYQLIAGERRWQAAKLAGLVRVPVVVREATPRDLLELALVENVQRADLNPLEEAAAYQQLAEEFGLTQEQIGQRVGKSRFAVANTLRLLHLPARVQQAVLDGLLSEGHARALLGLADREALLRAAQRVIDEGLSVRQTEELVRRTHVSRQSDSPRRPRLSADILDLEERFRTALGTKVSLTRSRRGGRLTIHYYDDEQLQSIYDRLAGSD
jgi:ParB family chromosome partitioning protein